ncbi:hypothetical protein V8B97DRAFT_1199621 [Scleroderma yunnanense]
MTPEEIEKERQEVLEELGSHARDLLRRVQEARLRKLARKEATKGAETEKLTENVSNPDQGRPVTIAQHKLMLPSLGA